MMHTKVYDESLLEESRNSFLYKDFCLLLVIEKHMKRDIHFLDIQNISAASFREEREDVPDAENYLSKVKK
jgi:hypothetical protein